MALPKQVLNILDPGIPKVSNSAMVAMVFGPCAQGSTTAIQTITSPAEALATYGVCPLSRDISHILRYGGGPVRALGFAPVAGDVSTVTHVGGGPASPTVSGDPARKFAVKFEITTAGALNTAEARYAIDAAGYDGVDPDWFGPVVIPTDGVVELTDTGLTVTFGAGPYVVGDTYSFTTTDPTLDPDDLADAGDLLKAYQLSYRHVLISGEVADAAAANTLAGKLDTMLGDLEDSYVFKRGIMSASYDTAANVAAGDIVTDFTSSRVCVVYGEALVTGVIPLDEGESNYLLPVAVLASAQVSGPSALISTDPAWPGAGALRGVLGISHDEAVEESLDELKIGTARTWPGLAGFFLTNVHIKSQSASDFRYIQHGFVMDRACEVTYAGQLKYLSASLRTGAGGVIAEEDALTIEADLKAQLSQALLEPRNAQGTKGHVSALVFSVDRTNNLLADEELITDVGIQPLGYPKLITTTLGFRVIAQA